MQALHLKQFTATTEQRLQLEAATTVLAAMEHNRLRNHLKAIEWQDAPSAEQSGA